MMLKFLALEVFGQLVSSRPGRALIEAIATPHRHLRDLDGGVYMYRWHVLDEDTLAGRILERLTGFSSIRLHRIMRPDHERDLHNHPFEYRTFVLDGYYNERYQDGVHGHPYGRTIRKGETTTGYARKFHRISEVSEGGVLTLFFMTRNQGEWGFNVDGKYHNSTRYLLRKGYTRTHVEEAQAR